jgi:hypothetical protein
MVIAAAGLKKISYSTMTYTSAEKLIVVRQLTMVAVEIEANAAMVTLTMTVI